MKKKLFFAVVMIFVLLFVGCSNAEVSNTGESNSSNEDVLGEEESEDVLENSSEGSTEVYYVCKGTYDVGSYGGEEKETFYYDENGTLTQSVDGLITYDYIYDEGGRIVKVCATELVDLKERKEYLTIEYDENNNVLSGKWYKDENEEEYVRGIEYIYDENGKLLQSIELEDDTQYGDKTKVYECIIIDYSYDEDGILQKEVWHSFYSDANCTPIEEFSEYEYIWEREITNYSSWSDEDTTYKYNENGDIIREVRKTSSGEYTYSYAYDEYGNLKTRTFHWYWHGEEKDGTLTSSSETVIDEFVWSKIEVKYDGMGNEIERTVLDADCKMCSGIPEMPEDVSKVLLYE
ncbi:MAG: hypothetical protein IJ336_10150 [Lachnospiraceae bacterium]|nr:hypothetical protein [Lachnospiraceae bacterium]MBQ7833918.1 hypothetical protein [Lachnospiraceae bacterium]